MREVTNDCVCCGLPCLGRSCPNRHALHIYCDRCGREISKDAVNYSDEGEELCYLCVEDEEDE